MALLWATTASAQIYSVDKKSEQNATQRFVLRGDSLEFVTKVVNAASTHKQTPTARAVWEALGGAGATIISNATLTGSGTSGSPLGIAQQGATNGQVLAWNGSAWVPNNQIIDFTGSAGVSPAVTAVGKAGQTWRNSVGELWRSDGTNWILVGGISNVSTNATLAGDGNSSPLGIAQQGATSGQVLGWNGTSWAPRNQPMDTIIVVSDGQSNSIGQGVPIAGKTYTFSQRIKVWNGSAFVAPSLGAAPFNPNGANNAALQFCQKITEKHKDVVVLLIQSGNSGQPISYWLGGTGINATNSVVTNAIGASKKIDIFVWTQGESDYLRTSNQYYTDYYTLRGQWLTETWYDRNTKHINVGLYTGAGSYLGFQNETLKNIGSDSTVQTSYCNPYGLTTYDNLHWDDPSLTDLGTLIYNTFLATPYAYKTAASTVAVNTSGFIPKSNGVGFVDSRVRDIGNNLLYYDATKKAIYTIESDTTATGVGDENVQVRFSARWGAPPNAASDGFNDASISLRKAEIFNNGGSDLVFRTSAFGAGGLTYQGSVNMNGTIDARTGFTVAGAGLMNSVLIGNGTSYNPVTPNRANITAWEGVGRDDLSVTDGVAFRSPTLPNSVKTSNRLVFVDNTVAQLRIDGGDGSNEGVAIGIRKGGAPMFSFGTESVFLGGTSNNGFLYQYGASNSFQFAGPNGSNLIVNNDRTVVVPALAGSGTALSTLSATGAIGRSSIDPSTILTTTTNAAGDVTGPLTNLQIAANAVTTAEIAPNTIVNGDIELETITTNRIQNGTVQFADWSSNGANLTGAYPVWNQTTSQWELAPPVAGVTILTCSAVTENIENTVSLVNRPSSSATTTINLPEIVTTVANANQVQVGYEVAIYLNASVVVTINRAGADKIYAHGQSPAGGTSLSNTANFVFSRKLIAIDLDSWMLL